MVGYVITPFRIGNTSMTPPRVQNRNRPSGMKCGEGEGGFKKGTGLKGRIEKRNRLEGQVKI